MEIKTMNKKDCYFTFSNAYQTQYWCNAKRINLNVNQMIECVKKSNVSFEHVFSTFVSHEVLHHVILKYVNDDACNKLDNICANRIIAFAISPKEQSERFYNSMSQWFGGIVSNKV